MKKEKDVGPKDSVLTVQIHDAVAKADDITKRALDLTNAICGDAQNIADRNKSAVSGAMGEMENLLDQLNSAGRVLADLAEKVG